MIRFSNAQYRLESVVQCGSAWLMLWSLRYSSTRSGRLQIHWCPLISFQSWTLLQSLSNPREVEAVRSDHTKQVQSFLRDKDCDYHWFMNSSASSYDGWWRLRRVCNIYLICSSWFGRFDCPFCVFWCASSSLPNCLPWSFELKSHHLLL